MLEKRLARGVYGTIESRFMSFFGTATKSPDASGLFKLGQTIAKTKWNSLDVTTVERQ